METTENNPAGMQTVLTPHPPAPNAPPPNPRAEWLDGLGLPEKVKPAFFQPESEPQRVIVVDLKGFGKDGVLHTIARQDDKGNIVEAKQVRKYAEAYFRDVKTGRESVWEVLSLPAAIALRDAVIRAGPDFRDNLVVEVRTEGRGLKKTFYVDVVSVARPPADDAGAEPEA